MDLKTRSCNGESRSDGESTVNTPTTTTTTSNSNNSNSHTTTTTTTTTNTGPVLVSFGNPLLDITAVVKDNYLHTTFKLPVDGQLEVNEEQRCIFKRVLNEYPVEYTAGGCALNSSRVFCWVLGEAQKVVFVGGIGKDEGANKLSKIVEESGVITRFVVVDDKPTGVCVALVLGACRCLCADIGAAATCLPHHVFTPDLMPILEEARYIYVEGYFITHSFPAALQIARYAQEHNKTLVFNLCGSYVCQNHPEELHRLLPFVDVLFGFEEEYRTLDHHLDVQGMTNELDDDPGNITHDLLLVLQAIRGKGEVLEDLVVKDHGKTAEDVYRLSDGVCDTEDECVLLVNGCVDGEECVSDGVTTSLTNTGTINTSTNNGTDKSNTVTTTTTATTSTTAITTTSTVSAVSTTIPTSSTTTQTTSNTSDSSNSSSNSSSSSSNGSMTNGSRSSNSSSSRKQKLVVVTRGPSPLLYSSRGVVRQRAVPPITPGEIIDTTGAGDSFVGGFLAALSSGRALDECLDCGVWTAQQLLRQKGCTLPPYPAEFLVTTTSH